MKIIINKCYGGFELSTQAFERLIELGMKVTEYDKNGRVKDKTADIIKHLGEIYGDYSFVKANDEIRINPLVIQVVEELGMKASTKLSELRVVEIPNNIEYEICNYDGIESVHEKHNVWS